jgi:glycosyltransferase involved in cell wall biosynthesis
MRFHVVGLASTQTTTKYLSCAYTQKARNFCRMMHGLGHEVFLYSGEENDAPCTEHICCISTRAQKLGVKDYHSAKHSPNAPHWMIFNHRAIGEMLPRAKIGDFLCIIFGMAQKPIADAMSAVLKPVEYGVGYHQTFAEHRVFESYAWMHTVYGAEKGSDRDGIWFDDVIHGYFDPADFAMVNKRKDHLLYLGRMVDRKGIEVAVEIAKASGRELYGAGYGKPPDGMKPLGELGVASRKKHLAQAHAVLMPTKYIEPFGNVAIEAMASGVPVITTDWGAFTETVKHGLTGWRCRTLQEFVDAVNMCGPEYMNGRLICDYAVKNFSIQVIAHKYQRYFERLSTLWKKGWYEMRDEQPVVVGELE